MSMKPRYLLGAAVLAVPLGACETISDTDEQARDRMNAQDVTIEELVNDPINNQWVRVSGWLEEPPFRFEVKLYASEAGLSDSAQASETLRIGIRKSELSAPISRGVGGQKVIVTGRVDTRCPDTHSWAASEMDRNPDVIIMASGYCHHTDLIHIDHAIVELASAA